MGISVMSNKLPDYSHKENGAIIVALLLTIFTGFKYEEYRFNKHLSGLIRKRKIDLDNGVIDFLMWTYPASNKISERVIQLGSVGLLPVVFVVLGIISVYIQMNYSFDKYTSKDITVALLAIIGGIYGFLIIGFMSFRYKYFYQWQKKNNRTIHTPLFQYLELQKEINLNRIYQGLKPLNIKKPYLTDKFYGLKKKK